MKVFGGSICGHKQQAREFVESGQAKGSYPVYICTVRRGEQHSTHYDNVHKVHF